MRAATAIVLSTVRQILGMRRLLLFGALAVLPAVVFFVSSANQSDRAMLNSLSDGVNTHFSLAVPVTALILSAAALGFERRDQTLSFVVIRPIPRITIAGSKLAAAFLAAVPLNAVGAILLAGLYGVRGGGYGYVLPLVAGSAIATLVYTAVFVPLGYLSERSTLIGLAYLFIWENGIVGGLGILGVTSPWRIGFMAFLGLRPADTVFGFDDFILSDLTPGAGTALLQAAFFLAAAVGLLSWILKQRDLV